MRIEVKAGKTGVAVSGGVDSMVLLKLFMESGADFCVINVEHGIRGETSLRDSEFVAAFCKKNGIECYTERVDALTYATEKKISVELAARELRYAVFERFLRENIVKRIALAHHADDNAETVLMRIFRGTGIKGLRGIVNNDKYIRPLLEYSRREIEEYAEANGIEYVTDETNADCGYTRNYIRNKLIPVVKERYPQAAETIARLSKNAAEVDEYLEKQAIKPQKKEDGCILIGLFDADGIIKKYSINAAMRAMGVFKDVEAVNFDGVIALGECENNASVDMPFGIVAVKRGRDLCLFRKKAEEFSPRSFDGAAEYIYCGTSYTFAPGEGITRGLSFDGDKAAGCVVRTRREGDKFHRVNGKNKLLSDFLNEKKLFKQEKDEILVLAKDGTVYVILGFEVAEEAKIDENTKNNLITIKKRVQL